MQKFALRLTGISGISSPVPTVMFSLGDVPLSISFDWNGRSVDIQRELSTEERQQLSLDQRLGVLGIEQAENELKSLIGSQS